MSVHYDEKGKIFTDVITKKSVAATIQTLTHIIHGYIHIKEGSRLKDELSRADQFLAVTNAEVTDAQGNILYRCDFIAIHRDHVIWIIPDEEKRMEDGNKQVGGTS